MAALPDLPNSDPEIGYTFPWTAEKHGWPESLPWYVRPEKKVLLPNTRNYGGETEDV